MRVVPMPSSSGSERTLSPMSALAASMRSSRACPASRPPSESPSSSTSEAMTVELATSPPA